MKNWTIGKRIAFGSGLLCLLVAGISVFAVLRLKSINKISDSVAFDSLPGAIDSGKVSGDQGEVQLRMISLLLAKTADERKALVDEIKQLTTGIDAAAKRYEGSIQAADDRQNYATFNKLYADYQANCTKYLSLVESNRT